MNDDKNYLSSTKIDSKVVVLRANLDIPAFNLQVGDHTKIQAIVPTINSLIANNCKVIILAHCGPQLDEHVDEFSLMDIRFLLGKYLAKQVKFVNAKQSLNSIKYLEPKDVLMVENLHFNPEEYSSEYAVQEKFMHNFTSFGEVFINEAFGVNDNYASIRILSSKLKSYYGLHYEKEIQSILKISTGKLNSPFLLVVGGNNILSKLTLIRKLINKVDKIIVGGYVALAFLYAKGVECGLCKFEESTINEIQNVLQLAKDLHKEILLPIDHYCVKNLSNYTSTVEINTQHISGDLYAVDIGPNTLIMFRELIESSSTIIWSGPMGIFENENSNKGTEAIGEYIALSTPKDAYKVVLGDATSAAVALLKIKQKRFDHISISSQKFVELLA
ncbi:MAG: phosphoglycerate kinase [Candidatus Dojkabacteria bacterium]|nr:phosphoglycerate kinase [Candidatus Dojkabacteria bacterium]